MNGNRHGDRRDTRIDWNQREDEMQGQFEPLAPAQGIVGATVVGVAFWAILGIAFWRGWL